MNKRLLIILGAVVIVFTISIVGASTINLSGSDSAPGEGKTVATCVQDLTVKTPVDTSEHDANSVKTVVISGALDNCVGETLRAEVDLKNGNHIYAVYEITSPLTELTLSLDQTTGNFYDTAPSVSGGELVVQGSRVAPVLVTDFGLTTITIATTWE